MIEKKHRALASLLLINDAVASNLAMICAWFLRFSFKIIPVTKGQQDFSTYLQLLPIVTIVFPLAFAVQGLYRIRPARGKTCSARFSVRRGRAGPASAWRSPAS